MDVNGTKKLLKILSTAYPKMYKDMSSEAKWEQVALYTDMFKDYPEEVVATALKAYIKVNEYPPTIAGIMKEINAMQASVSDDTIENCVKESWDAICGGRCYKDLSTLSQEYWGSQSAIDAMGMDEKTTLGVITGQMQRRLPEIIKRQKTRAELPMEVKSMLQGATSKLLEG